MSDEYEDTYTASDYWEDMYEETMLHVKYLYSKHLAKKLSEFLRLIWRIYQIQKKSTLRFIASFYNRGRSFRRVSILDDVCRRPKRTPALD